MAKSMSQQEAFDLLCDKLSKAIAQINENTKLIAELQDDHQRGNR